MDWNTFVGTTSLLFALANPIGVIPIFLRLMSTTLTGLRYS